MGDGPRGWRVIESVQNPSFKLWDTLQDGRGIRKAGLFILAGRKTVPEALRRWPDRFEAVLATDPTDVANLPLPEGLTRYLLARPLFARLDVSGTSVPLLVGRAPEMPEVDLSLPPSGLELVCALSDPSNLGALLRSAAAFGVRRVVLLEESANPYHPRCLRAASNAVFALDLARGPRMEALGGAAGPIMALDAGGEDMTRFDWPSDLRLVLGEEGRGLPDDLAVRRLSVPTTGAVESLNATVAASLALHAWYAAVGRDQSRRV